MPELRAALEGLAAHRAHAGLFFDFDGTLSRIVEDPGAARAVDGAADLLARLVGRYAAVTVISGRSVAALVERVDIPGVALLGLYGLERRDGSRIVAIPEAEAARDNVLRATADLARAFAGAPGVVVEPKGLAVSVHFRRAPDADEAMAEGEPVVAAVSERYGLGPVMRGRKVLELKPAVGVDKGVAVRRIIQERGLRAAMVAGDDAGDIPAFAALHDMDPALRIAVAGPDSPPALLAEATYTVASPEELVEALSVL